MNREQLQRLASEWVRMAKNDIRKKVIDFMHEVDASPRELAYHLAMSEGELQQITEGNGEITLTTFAKLLIATGNALEIKPIDETPIGDYENLPNEEEFERPLPRPNVFERPRPQMNHPQFVRPNFTRPIGEERENDFMPPIPESLREAVERRFSRPNRNVEEPNHEVRQPRDEHGRFAPRQETPSSPFASMGTDELVKIIRERLWDSEINLATASKHDLVKFLDEKNKRMAEFKRMKALENDPKVNEFIGRMKTTFKNNPHLRDWAKKILGEVVE
jgi:hypothetical protein